MASTDPELDDEPEPVEDSHPGGESEPVEDGHPGGEEAESEAPEEDPEVEVDEDSNGELMPSLKHLIKKSRLQNSWTP